MAVKSFIRGDFRTLIIDNDYPTNYKVYYNGRWNYIQDEESFIKRLNPNLGESYLNRFNLKILDNNQWVKLAILDNYYNKSERKNSIFYRTITRENFNFKARAVNFTEVDARLGLNNLQTPFASNEIKYDKEEIENITDKLEKDEVLYKVGYINQYDELEKIKYIRKEENNFVNDEIDYAVDMAFLKYKESNKQIITFDVEENITHDEFSKIINDSSVLSDNYIAYSNFDIYYNLDTISNFNSDNYINYKKNHDELKSLEPNKQIINFDTNEITDDNYSIILNDSRVLISNYVNN